MTPAAQRNAEQLVELMVANPNQVNKWYAKQLGWTPAQLRTARLDAERMGTAIVHQQRGKRHRSSVIDDAPQAAPEKEIDRSEKALISSTKTHNMKCDNRNLPERRRVSLTEAELMQQKLAAVTKFSEQLTEELLHH